VSQKTGAKSARRKLSLLRLEPVLEIVKASIWTGRLSDEKPVSIMLVAEQESAKTETLKYFRGTPTLKFVSDLTSRGLIPYKKEIETGMVRHIVLLDVVRIISHGRNIADRTLQTLASLMEEGESETSDAGGRDTWKDFPRIGVLMALTPAFFRSKRGKWRETGFLTRFVPVSFSYSEKAVHEIHLAIAAGHQLPVPHAENIPALNYAVNCEAKYSAIIARRAEELGERMRTYGFRYQRIMRALAKAQARIQGRGYVTSEDVGKVLSWSEFFTDKEVEL
jgi:hypothetical protein